MAGLALSLALTGCGGGGAAQHGLVVGGVEDAAKWGNPSVKMQLARRANFRAIVLSSVWTPPLTAPSAPETPRLRAAVDAAKRAGIRPIVAVYSFGDVTPLTPRARGRFASYAASILRAIPQIRDMSVGNEPNSQLFWRPQFGPGGSDVAAASYLALLAQTYDALKAVDRHVNVIGGSLAARGSDNPNGRRKTHSPTRFIEDLGAALAASGRTRPALDMFSLHPYPENSSIFPTAAHPHSTAIGIADYDKLVGLLEGALGRPVPIVYGEYGVDTMVPSALKRLYSGHEQPSARPVDEATQALNYGDAIRLAACQPLVRMLIFFHVTDESQLAALQTGLFYPNDRPKRSLDSVASSARAAEAGQVKCPS
jgi:hypothetical protein